MCDDKYKMEQPLIDQMFDLVFKEEQEHCIIFSKHENRILKFSNKRRIGETKIENEEERASCNFPPKDEGMEHPYLFHSHPMKSRSYPSFEDVVKLLRHPEVYLSVIATRWGIYVLKTTAGSKKYAEKYSSLDKKHQMKKYKEKFGKHLRKIGHLENDKGFKEGNYLSLDESDIEYIKKKLSYISDETKLEIKFCPWNALNKSKTT